MARSSTNLTPDQTSSEASRETFNETSSKTSSENPSNTARQTGKPARAAKNADHSAEIVGKPVKPIARKFAISVSLLLLLAMCVFWLINSYNTQLVLRQQADSLGQTLAQQTASQLTELVLANDLISMNVVLGSLIENPAIAEVSVMNVDRRMIAAASASNEEPGLLLPLPITLVAFNQEYTAAIRLAESLAGYVTLSLDLTYIEAALVNNLLLVVGAALILVLATYLLITLYLQYLISYPANMLAFSLSNIRQGNIETCPEPKGNSELSTAIRQYNATAEFLAQNTFLSNFGSRLPSDAQQLQTQPGQQDVTLLCIKLSNFQFLASTQTEDLMIRLLNKFYFFAGKVSQLYNGRVSFCFEDEVLINFSGEMLEEEQAFFAICAGQLFLQLVDDVSDVADTQVGAKFRLAVHSGQAVIDLYSPVTQDTTNLAGKTLDVTRSLCHDCPDNTLLISTRAFELAGAGNRIEAREYGWVGEPEAVDTFMALEPMSDYKLLLERQAIQLVTLYSE